MFKDKLELIFGHIQDGYIEFKILKNAIIVFPNEQMITNAMRERTELLIRYKDELPSKIQVEKKVKDEAEKNDIKYYTERQRLILINKYQILFEKYKQNIIDADGLLEISKEIDYAELCQNYRSNYGQHTLEEVVNLRTIYFQIWDCLRKKERNIKLFDLEHYYESSEMMVKELTMAQLLIPAVNIFKDIKSWEKFDFLEGLPALVKGGQ